MASMDLMHVVVLVHEPWAPFEYGVVHEVFGIDRTAEGVPPFTLVTATHRPEVPTELAPGVHVRIDEGLEALHEADLVVVPSGPAPGGASPDVLEALRESHAAGAHLLGTCTGVFTLAEAGLLDGGTATVHWRHAALLDVTYPEVRVDREALYRSDGRVVTSAGTSAGVDACLHLVRRSHGAAVTNRIARRMVSAPHRPGGQLQYLEHPVPESDDSAVQATLLWIEEHLAESHTLASLARRAHVSTRTLTRRFRRDTGASPLAWVTARRVARAQQLLETTGLSVDAVAREVGFETGTRLRHHFRSATGTTPSEYRTRFGAPA